MGPFSHTYVSTKVTDRSNPLLVFGSVLPDITWSTKTKAWRKIHNNPKSFYDFIKNNYPKLLELGIGVLLHADEGRGADYYSDDNKVGFAKLEANKVESEVESLLGLDKKGISMPLKFGVSVNSNSLVGKALRINRKIVTVIAHNFIEGGVDLNLLEKNKSIVTIYKNALVKFDTNSVIPCLAQFLETDEKTVETELMEYLKLINPKNFVSLKTSVDKTVLPFLENRLERKINSEKTIKILRKAQAVTALTHKSFLDKAITQMKLDFKGMT